MNIRPSQSPTPRNQERIIKFLNSRNLTKFPSHKDFQIFLYIHSSIKLNALAKSFAN